MANVIKKDIPCKLVITYYINALFSSLVIELFPQRCLSVVRVVAKQPTKPTST